MPEIKTENRDDVAKSEPETPARRLTPQARQALEESDARRQAYLKREAEMPREIGGRGGKEPGRYGDWEIKGLTSDF